MMMFIKPFVSSLLYFFTLNGFSYPTLAAGERSETPLTSPDVTIGGGTTTSSGEKHNSLTLSYYPSRRRAHSYSFSFAGDTGMFAECGSRQRRGDTVFWALRGWKRHRRKPNNSCKKISEVLIKYSVHQAETLAGSTTRLSRNREIIPTVETTSWKIWAPLLLYQKAKKRSKTAITNRSRFV